MTALTTPATVTAEQLLADSDLTHVVHCDDDTALCGLDLTGLDWIDSSEETSCVVCVELEDAGYCPLCGCYVYLEACDGLG